MKRLEWVLVMSVALMGCDRLGAEASAGESTQGREAADADLLARLEREVAQARSGLAARDEKIAALEDELRRLEQTPQGLFDLATEAMNAERWSEAEKLFGELAQRFPNDPLADSARAKQAQVRDAELVAYLQSLDGTLDLQDKSSFAKAAELLAAKIEACAGCKSRRQAKSELRAIETALRQWPIELGGLKELAVRYGDLRGRLVALSERIGVEAATYYNCKFDSQSRWRSLSLQNADYDRVHGYCRRGNEDCERLFALATAEMVVVDHLVVRYPAHNSICEEGQVEIIAWGQ